MIKLRHSSRLSFPLQSSPLGTREPTEFDIQQDDTLFQDYILCFPFTMISSIY